MGMNIMFQSTLSGAGKSLITAAVCRYLYKKGYKVSPFKTMNISLNSYITQNGREIGISQAFQSWACGKEPCHQMNPILLKATGNRASQLIVEGIPRKGLDRHGPGFWDEMVSVARNSYEFLEEKNDIIVIEGSGTPAEINLRDLANMGTAEITASPVILIGDIDTGGVFAGLYGTYHLLEERHRRLLKGFLINKFRGDRSILGPGIERIEDALDVPCLGILSFKKYSFPEEDSLSLGGGNTSGAKVDDVRDMWLQNLDLFLENMKEEIRFDIMEKIIEKGV